MARMKSKADLQAELDEANEYIEELEGKLDDIAGIATEEEDSEDDSCLDEEEEEGLGKTSSLGPGLRLNVAPGNGGH